MTTAGRELQGAWNFRDVADATGVLRSGRLFRSADLSGLGDGGRLELRRLGLTDVADLRSRREMQRNGPGRVPEGVDIHCLPIPDLPVEPADADDPDDAEAPHEHAFERLLTEKPDDESPADAAARFMVDEYRRFPTYDGAQRALHRVVTLLGGGRTVLTHCFAGKDRTGFMVAVVLEAIGLDQDTILADYLRSNTAVPQLRAQLLDMVQRRSGTELTPEVMGFVEVRLSDEVLGVRAEYLAAARDAIDETYGSLEHYLRDAGISAADVDRLRTALLA